MVVETFQLVKAEEKQAFGSYSFFFQLKIQVT